MLRSRANNVLKPDESAPVVTTPRRRQNTRNKKSSSSSSTTSNIVFCALSFALTLFIANFSYSNYTKNIAHDHIVQTKHLRKSAFHKEDIESPQQDDLVPVDSIYSLTYPTMKHHGELFELSNIAGRVALVINVASE
jgi:hypothetical protein